MVRKKVLIVDDEPDTLEIVRLILEQHDYEVLTAVDGDSALSSIEKNPPNLVLLDIMLPDISGFEICQKIKSSAKKDISVIIFTAKSGMADLNRGIQCGADEYLTKPFSAEGLLKIVERYLK